MVRRYAPNAPVTVAAVPYDRLVPDARQHPFPRPVDVGVIAAAVIVAGAFYLSAASKHILAYDARTGYLPLAHQVVNGISPYPEANLPPLGFFVFIPFTPVRIPRFC